VRLNSGPFGGFCLIVDIIGAQALTDVVGEQVFSV
jgi:hypothetical protein